MSNGDKLSTTQSDSGETDCQIGPASSSERAGALALVFGDLPPEVRAATCEQLITTAKSRSFDGLFVVRRDGQLRGAAWARLGDGRLASVWPPRLCHDEPRKTVPKLLAALDRYLEQRHVKLAQSLLDPSEEDDIRQLMTAGYQVSTDLIYLACVCGQFPARRPESRLEFKPYSMNHHQRLVDLVNRTYADTRDFPVLNGICDAADALDGYRETGAFHPENWLFVRQDGVDVGCLLLADHPQDNQFELVYMGIVPQARGQSFGADVTRRALWLTGAAGRRQLVLGVDAANEPALQIYRRLGFTEWDRRRVLLKTFGV